MVKLEHLQSSKPSISPSVQPALFGFILSLYLFIHSTLLTTSKHFLRTQTFSGTKYSRTWDDVIGHQGGPLHTRR
jgi:hypothetical protein